MEVLCCFVFLCCHVAQTMERWQMSEKVTLEISEGVDRRDRADNKLMTELYSSLCLGFKSVDKAGHIENLIFNTIIQVVRFIALHALGVHVWYRQYHYERP